MSKLTIIAAVAAPLAAIAGTLEVPFVKFADGIAMPRFGIGTYAQGSNEICSNSVSTATRSSPSTSQTPAPSASGSSKKRSRRYERRNL